MLKEIAERKSERCYKSRKERMRLVGNETNDVCQSHTAGRLYVLSCVKLKSPQADFCTFFCRFVCMPVVIQEALPIDRIKSVFQIQFLF